MDMLMVLVRVFDMFWLTTAIVFWYIILKDKDWNYIFWGAIIIGITAFAGSVISRITMGGYLLKWWFMAIDIAIPVFFLLLAVLVLLLEEKGYLNKKREKLLMGIMRFLVFSSFGLCLIGVIIRLWIF